MTGLSNFFLQVTCAPLFWTECFRCKVYLNTSEEVCQIRWSITFFELPYCASPTHNHRRTINSSDLRYWRNQCCYWFLRFRSYVSLLKYSSWPAWYCSGWVRIVCFETSRRDLNHLIATALGAGTSYQFDKTVSWCKMYNILCFYLVSGNYIELICGTDSPSSIEEWKAISIQRLLSTGKRLKLIILYIVAFGIFCFLPVNLFN